MRSLLLVRNAVNHDARVLRAARVAERSLGETALIVGVATATAPAGAAIVEGVPVIRLPARTPGLTRLLARLKRDSPKSIPNARKGPIANAADGSSSARTGASDVTPGLTWSARLRRILGGLSYSRQAISVAHQTRPTLVHANDWNTMWTGVAIKLRYGTRLVYDSHELWPDRNGRWEWRPWLLASEALFVRAADEVITSSPGYAEVLVGRYRIPRPAVVRNIPERPPSAVSVSPPERNNPRNNPISPPRVVYIGGLMPGRGLEQMIDALPHIPDVRLWAIGPGAAQYRASLLTRATAAGVEERIELRAPVSPGEVGDALAGAAAGLCLIQPICKSYELSLPNKLFEYAAAGVPVLASDVPVIATVVRDEGLGEVVPPGGPRAIAASLELLLAPDGWQLAAQRARGFACAHNWTGEAHTLSDVYRRVAGEVEG